MTTTISFRKYEGEHSFDRISSVLPLPGEFRKVACRPEKSYFYLEFNFCV